MNTTADYLETWFKTQETITKSWLDSSRKMQEAFTGNGKTTDTDIFNLYSSWTKPIFDSLGKGTGINEDIVKETMSKVFGSTNAYARLYEIWLPLAKAIQDKTFSPDSWKDALDPAKYQEVMNKVWGFNPEAVEEFNKQASRLAETFGKNAEQFVNPWSEAITKNIEAAPRFFEGHPESIMNAFHNLFKAFDSTIGTAFHVPQMGKDREKVELVLRWLDDLAVYTAKNTEYQHVMYATGQAAMEKVIATVAQKLKEGTEVKDFTEFFNLWIDLNEKTFYNLFQTDEFSKLQGQVLDADIIILELPGLVTGGCALPTAAWPTAT